MAHKSGSLLDSSKLVYPYSNLNLHATPVNKGNWTAFRESSVQKLNGDENGYCLKAIKWSARWIGRGAAVVATPFTLGASLYTLWDFTKEEGRQKELKAQSKNSSTRTQIRPEHKNPLIRFREKSVQKLNGDKNGLFLKAIKWSARWAGRGTAVVLTPFTLGLSLYTLWDFTREEGRQEELKIQHQLTAINSRRTSRKSKRHKSSSSSSSNSSSHSTKSRDQLQSELNRAQLTRGQAEALAEGRLRLLTEAQNKLAQQERQIGLLRTENETLRHEIDELRKNGGVNVNQQDEIDRLTNLLDQKTEALTRAEDRYRGLDAACRGLIEKHNEIEQHLKTKNELQERVIDNFTVKLQDQEQIYQRNIENLQKQLSDLNDSCSNLKFSNNLLTHTLEIRKNELITLQAQLETQEQAINSSGDASAKELLKEQETVRALQLNIDSLRITILETEDTLRREEETLQEVRATIIDIKNKHSIKKKQLEEQITNLRNELNENDAELKLERAANNTLNDSLNQLHTDLSSKENELTNLRKQLENLSSSKPGADVSAEAQFTKLENEKLQIEINRLNGEITILQEQQEEIIKNNELNNQQVQNEFNNLLQESINKLTQINETLQTEKAAIENDLKVLRENNLNEIKEIASSTILIEQLESKDIELQAVKKALEEMSSLKLPDNLASNYKRATQALEEQLKEIQLAYQTLLASTEAKKHDIEALNETNTKLKKLINDISSSADKNNEIAKKEETRLQTEIENLNKELKNANNRQTQHFKNEDNLKRSIQQLKNQNKDNEKAVKKLNEQIESLEKQITSLNGFIELFKDPNNNENIVKAKKLIKEKNSKINDLESTLYFNDIKITDLNEAREKYIKNAKSDQEKLADQKQNLDNLEKDYNDLTTEHNKLVDELNEEKQEVAKLKQLLSSSGGSSAPVSGDTVSKAKYDELEAQIAPLVDNLQEQMKRISDLEKSLKHNQALLNPLETKAGQLENSIRLLNHEKLSLNKDNGALRKQLEDLQIVHNNLLQELEELKKSNSNSGDNIINEGPSTASEQEEILKGKIAEVREKMKEKLQKFKDEYAITHSKLIGDYNALVKEHNDLAKAHNNLGYDSTTKLAQAKEKIKELTEKLRKSKTFFDEIKNRYEDSSEQDRLEHNELVAKYNKQQNHLNIFKNENKNLHKQIFSLNEKIDNINKNTEKEIEYKYIADPSTQQALDELQIEHDKLKKNLQAQKGTAQKIDELTKENVFLSHLNEDLAGAVAEKVDLANNLQKEIDAQKETVEKAKGVFEQIANKDSRIAELEALVEVQEQAAQKAAKEFSNLQEILDQQRCVNKKIAQEKNALKTENEKLASQAIWDKAEITSTHETATKATKAATAYKARNQQLNTQLQQSEILLNKAVTLNKRQIRELNRADKKVAKSKIVNEELALKNELFNAEKELEKSEKGLILVKAKTAVFNKSLLTTFNKSMSQSLSQSQSFTLSQSSSPLTTSYITSVNEELQAYLNKAENDLELVLDTSIDTEENNDDDAEIIKLLEESADKLGLNKNNNISEDLPAVPQLPANASVADYLNQLQAVNARKEAVEKTAQEIYDQAKADYEKAETDFKAAEKMIQEQNIIHSKSIPTPTPPPPPPPPPQFGEKIDLKNITKILKKEPGAEKNVHNNNNVNILEGLKSIQLKKADLRKLEEKPEEMIDVIAKALTARQHAMKEYDSGSDSDSEEWE